MPIIRQPSFASGELAPDLYGRTDLPRYQAGVRTLRNFFLNRQGSAVSRPGAQMLGFAASNAVQTKNYSGGFTHGTNTGIYVNAGANVKLTPFYFSTTDTTQNYVLEWGEQSLRIWKNGVPLSITLTGSIPYAASDLFKLRWIQSGDTVTLTCAGYPPATLVRTDETHWTYAAISFARAPPADISPNPRMLEDTVGAVDASHPEQAWSWLVTERTRDSRGVITESAPQKAKGFIWFGEKWSTWVPYKNGTIVAYPTDTGHGIFQRYWSSTFNGNSGNQPPNNNASDSNWNKVPLYDPAHSYSIGDIVTNPGNDGPSVWSSATQIYVSQKNANVGSSLLNPTFWLPYDTAFQEDDWSNIDVQLPLSADRPVTLWIPTSAGNSAFGGTSANGDQFVSFVIYRGRAGNFGFVGYSAGPFFVDNGAEPDLTDTPPQGLNPFVVGSDTEYPNACSYYQDRLEFGGTPSRPTTVLASATSDYYNFDQHLAPVDSDSVIFALLARKLEIIRAMVGLDKNFVFTNGGVWVVGGTSDSPFSPQSIDAHIYSDVGADWPVPLVLDGIILYVRDKGTGIRGIQYDWQRGGFASADLSAHAKHLLLGHTVKDWCYAEDPWGVVWLARDDGVLLSLTKSADEDMWGWAQHYVATKTSSGGVVPSGKILSLCSIPEGDEDAVYLAMQGPALALPAWSNSTGYTIGQGVSFNGHNFVALLSGGGHQPNSDGSSSTYWGAFASTVQSAWIMRFSTRQEIAGSKDPACLDAYAEYDSNFQPSDVTENFAGSIFLSDLSHLNGQFVYVQYNNGTTTVAADFFGPYLVSGGFIVAPAPTRPATKAFVGLEQGLELELLDLGESRTLRKNVTEVCIEMIGAGQLNVGPDLGNLVKSKAEKPSGDLLRTNIMGGWQTGGRAVLTCTNPLPLTILGVSREVAVGDE